MKISASIDSNNIYYVTAMRGIAAFYVMISHVWYQVWPAVPPPFGYADYPEGLTAVLTGWLYYGHFGVVTFIFVSGFCLMIPVLRYGGIQNLAQFFYKRCRRIMPPYYAALFISILLATTVLSEQTGTQWDISVPVTWEGILSHLFMYQHLAEPTQINYPLWSISVELHLYIFFPIFVVIWRRCGVWMMVFLVSSLVFATMVTMTALQVKDIPPSFLGLILHFVLGMACCHIVLSGPLPRWVVRISGPAACGFAVLLVVTCAGLGHEQAEENFYAIDLIVIAALFCGFIHLSFSNTSARITLSHPSLIKLGDMSYSVYLIHAPIIHILWLLLATRVDKTHDFIILNFAAIPVTLILAYLFYLMVERPFLSPKVAKMVG